MSAPVHPSSPQPGHGAPGLASAPSWLVLLLAGLMVAAPLSSKSAGLPLLVLLLVALWTAWRRPAALPIDPLVLHWFWIAGLVLVLRGAATLFWQDAWGDRHFELRLLLSAITLWLLCPRMVWSEAHKKWLRRALALACWAALGLTWLHGRDTPTNPIPWAAGVGFFVCVMLAQGADARSSPREQALFLFSGLAGLAGVILSQSRGSLGLLPWSVLVLAWVLWRSARQKEQVRPLFGGALSMAVLLVLIAAVQPRLYQEPLARVQLAWQELSASVHAIKTQSVSPEVTNTSVGARLHMYIHGWEQIQQSPVTGHGVVQRRAWVQALGQHSGSIDIRGLRHLHSDPLSIWFEHGLPGLASYLLSVGGLAWLAWRSRARGAALSLGFAGLAWMHASTGLTNMNTLHNFYGVMLSLSVLLLFLLDRSPEPTHRDS